MRALILTDGSFARREQPMLARLEVGLTAEGVRVAQAVPIDCLSEVAASVSSPVVGYEEGAGRFTRRGRARRLVAAVAAMFEVGTGAEEPWLDVVHCLGYTACETAIEVARMTGAGVAVEVWSGEVVGRARELSVHRAGRSGEPPLVFFAVDGAIASVLGGGEGGGAGGGGAIVDPIELTPWGVHVPAGSRRPIDVGGAISVAVLTDGVDPRAILAVVDALGQVTARYPGLLVFFDADVGQRAEGGHAVWQRAKRAKMLDRLSMVGSMEGHREPILHVDILLQPEAVGAHHSLTLDAMASGVVVIAKADPLVESLIHGRTAVLVEKGTPAEWAAAIEGVLRDAGAGGAEGRVQRLRESAREYVREHRSASRHVEAVLRGYERLAGMPATV